MEFDKYVATGGQSSRPFGQFKVPYPKWERLERPTGYPEFNMNPDYKDWVICIEGEHFLPGVTSKMIDWFWCNMEKGYFLWAPGSQMCIRDRCCTVWQLSFSRLWWAVC